jgi:hypothetical protein
VRSSGGDKAINDNPIVGTVRVGIFSNTGSRFFSDFRWRREFRKKLFIARESTLLVSGFDAT